MLELNHKVYEIYGAENKPVEINNPKETQILINGEPNGAMLHDVFKKIDDLGTNKIYGWSILEYYKAEEGFLIDNDGNKIHLMEGETEIFFKRVKNPLIILNEKEVNLDYIRDVSTLLGLSTIEETIIGLDNDDKTLLVEERMAINEKRQKQIQREKADADARERAKLEAEQKRIEQEQKEEQERLDALDQERILAEKQAEETAKQEEERLKAESEEKERIEAEALAIAQAEEESKNKTAAERAQLIAEAKAEAKKEFELEMEERRKEEQEQEKLRQAEEAEKQKEAKEKEAKKEEEKEEQKEEESANIFDPKQFRNIRKSYANNDVNEFVSNDGKYTFFFSEDMSGDDEPMLVLKRDDGKYEEIDGELTEDGEKFSEFEFKRKGKEMVVVLNKKTNSIKIEVID